MPVVLVVEQDASYAQRIAAALSAMGHDVDLVADTESAARRAAVRAPQLVVVSGSLPDAESTLARYSQRRGGPGSLVMAPLAHAGQVSAEQFQADLLLYKPFSEDDLRQAVGRLLSRSAASSPPAATPSAPPTTAPTTIPAAAPPQPDATANPLTSADIFGDVLAEVEQEARRAEARPPQPTAPQSPPASGQPAAPRPTPAPSQPAPAQPPAAAVPPQRRPAPAKPRSRSGDDINRKLEETLSGVLPDKLRRQDKPRPTKRRVKPTDDDIDSLLDKTLSSLELPRKVRRQKASDAAPAAPVSQPPPAAAPEPAAPKPAAPTPTAPPTAAQAPPPAAQAPPPTAQPAPPQPAAPPARPQEPAPRPAPDPAAAQPPTPAEPPTPSFASDSRAETESPSFDLPSFEPPDIPALEVDPPAEPFELPPTEPAIPPTASADSAPAPFEPPSIDFEPPSLDLEPPPATPSASHHPSPFEAFDTSDVESNAASETAADDAPTGWSVTSFEEVGTTEPTASPFATELVPSVPDSPPIAEAKPPSEDTFTDVEFPSDFAAAFAPPPAETEAGEDTGGALEKVLEVRGAATPQDEGTPFGDYRLLDRVAVGGMAEVWRARRRGVEGFQKTVAIKRILYHLTGNDDFVTMFIDEAKLAAQLHHAHIVQIYDLGKVDDDFFIAMEYVDGKDLRTILNQANQVGVRLPLRLALEIITAVAKALDYAHRKKDDNDRDLGLVHRDVSPQNVLIGYESEIKLCDFGIVKAVVKASTTQMGALKGKLQYMSPEQAWGREVDSRSDIFSLGSVLFEVLTGERLFTGDSEIGVLDAVRDGKVRSPRELDPEIPESVEQIALRALTEDPDRRYQTADEMVRDLNAALETLGPAPRQLGEFLGTLFPRATTSGVRDISVAEPADAPSMVAEPTTAPQTTASGGRARSLLIAAIVVTALLAIGTIIFFSLRGDDEPTAPATAAPPPAAAPATDPATGDPAAAGDAEGAAAPADPDRVQELIDQALQDQVEQMDADYEEKRRLLEKELAEVQGGGGGP